MLKDFQKYRYKTFSFIQLWSLNNSFLYTLCIEIIVVSSTLNLLHSLGNIYELECTHVVNNGQTIGYSKGF